MDRPAPPPSAEARRRFLHFEADPDGVITIRMSSGVAFGVVNVDGLYELSAALLRAADLVKAGHPMGWL